MKPDWSQNIFWTSDTHGDHGNVIRYCDRPFAVDYLRGPLKRPSEVLGRPVSEVPYEELKSSVLVDVDAMNRTIKDRWNSVVGPRDIVFHLGDVHLGKRPMLKEFVSKLNGYKILVRGNHDRSREAMLESGFDEVHEEYTLEVPGTGVYVFMHHQPVARGLWPRHADVHFCGHVHEKWRRKGDVVNVGVDQWDFTPQTFRTLYETPKQGTWPTPKEME